MPEDTLYAVPRISRSVTANGEILLKSEEPLGNYPESLIEMLRSWASADSNHPLAAERRPDGGWSYCSYGQALAGANAIGQALLDRGLTRESPLMILSDNSIGHLLMALGALTVGVPVAPISVAYSLRSQDHARIKAIKKLITPGAVYVEDAEKFGAALAALGGDLTVFAANAGPTGNSLDDLLDTKPRLDVENAFERVTKDTIAKILFTSGSTGTPKGVVNTHEMLCANQQMMRQAWPFLTVERPVIVDWLPWSHTFGGNHNLNMVLANGGTIYIDDGRPTPELIGKSVANYRAVSPTLLFNVPAGYALLAPILEQNADAAKDFFRNIRLVFNAAAALPTTLRQRLEDLARKVTGRDIPVTGSWGTTETSPAATSAHFSFSDARSIGVPLPGVAVKLVPSDDGDTYELRVKGRSITPTYYRKPELNQAAFDAEGYYRPGDAVSFADPDDDNKGLLFRGRIVEDFKLSTGTFVHVGALRIALLSAAPVLSDIVIAGEGRDEVGALAWLNEAEVRRILSWSPSPGEEILYSEDLAKYLIGVLREFNRGSGSSARIERLLLMGHPPNLDLGEVTDKGSINQRQVLANRANLVDLLYIDPPIPQVILMEAGSSKNRQE